MLRSNRSTKNHIKSSKTSANNHHSSSNTHMNNSDDNSIMVLGFRVLGF